MSLAKRALDASPAAPSAIASKRTRMVQLPRLCDLPDGVDIFANAHNQVKAREKGILRSRDAKAKYEEVSVQTSNVVVAKWTDRQSSMNQRMDRTPRAA